MFKEVRDKDFFIFMFLLVKDQLFKFSFKSYYLFLKKLFYKSLLIKN